MNNRCDSYAILFVQSAPSQLDSSFYSELSKRTGGRIALALMHDGNAHRTQADPELGVIPQFPPLSDGYPILHLPSEMRGGLKKLIALTVKLRPHLLVVQDQSWHSKIVISIACRLAGVKVIMRSDKNELSSTSKTGLLRLVEVFLVKALFDGIAPVSKLTVAYYRWSGTGKIWWFPYPSSKSKFARDKMYWDIRRRVRDSFNIPESHCVYLAVVKFVERENPDGVIHAFHELQKINSDVSLLIVGAGPMESQLKARVNDLRIENIYFCGYIAYSGLQDFFWAADVFVHLAWVGPWEVSPQDALVAKMCLVTSNRVGSGVCHLDGELSRFVVAPDDPLAAAQAMLEASAPNAMKHFAKAWASVTKYFTSEELAKWWADEIAASGWLVE